MLFASLGFATTSISSCVGDLTTPGETYVLTASISTSGVMPCLYTYVNNITLDCDGFPISYAGGGVFGSMGNGTTVQNCYMEGNAAALGVITFGLNGYPVQDEKVIDTTAIHTSNGQGIKFYGASNSVINNSYGYSYSSSGILIRSNVGAGSGVSENNTVVNSVMQGALGISILASSNTVVINNTIFSGVWITDDTGTNFYNDSTTGNIYIMANGTPASSIYNATCSYTTPCFADGGTDIPFSASLSGGVWVGLGEDYHPYSYYAASPAQIEYCGASNATAVTWIAYDLLTNTLIPFNVTTTIQQIVGSSLVVGNFTGVGNSTENFSLCVNPGYGTVYAQLSDTVASVGYSPIQWTHLAQNYTIDTSVYSIYMLPSAGNNTKLVQIYVVDSTFTPMLNVSVKIQQMNPITSAIILLGSFLVDSFGSTTQALQPATQLYHFTVVTPTGAVLQDYNNQAIPCTSAELICKMVLVVKGNNAIPVVPAVNATGTGYVGSTAFGRDAWLAAILLVVVAATLMTGNMAVSMVLGVFGLFTALAFGIIPLADAPVAVLFAVIALVIAYRLRI